MAYFDGFEGKYDRVTLWRRAAMSVRGRSVSVSPFRILSLTRSLCRAVTNTNYVFFNIFSANFCLFLMFIGIFVVFR